MEITRGIVIRQPWIEHILAGRKSWEIRGRSCNIRGPVALIEGGSGRIVGVATITGCQGPLSRSERVKAAANGQILPEEVDEDIYEHVYAWTLEAVVRLDKSISYIHPSGAVIWVSLDPGSKKALDRATRSYGIPATSTPTRTPGRRASR